MRKTYLTFISTVIFVYLSGVCFGETRPNHECDKRRCSHDVETVSIIELVSNGSKYDGKRIRVKGYISLEHEGAAVFLSEENYRYLLYENAISLLVDDWVADQKECHKNFCLIEGTFNTNAPAHFGRTKGRLKDIYRVDKIMSRDDIQRLRESS